MYKSYLKKALKNSDKSKIKSPLTVNRHTKVPVRFSFTKHTSDIMLTSTHFVCTHILSAKDFSAGAVVHNKCSCCCCVWEKRVKRTSVIFLYNQRRHVGGSSVWRENDTCSITSIGPSLSFVAVITQMGV